MHALRTYEREDEREQRGLALNIFAVMLRTSYILTPTQHEDIVDTAAEEHLHAVYVCAVAPQVTEVWAGWPVATCVVAGDTRIPIVDLRTAAAEELPVGLSSSSARYSPVSLPLLCKMYDAVWGEGKSGSALVQIYPVGPYGALSLVGRAALSGCVAAVLRAELSRLLCCLYDSTKGGHHPPLDADMAATVKKCCRAVHTSASTPSGLPPAKKVEEVEEMESATRDAAGIQGWRVTWSTELILKIVNNFAADASIAVPIAFSATQRVIDAGNALGTSLQWGLCRRLQLDSCPTPAGRDAAMGAPPYSAALPQQQACPTGLLVRLTECIVAESHPLDVRSAVQLAQRLYDSFLRPADADAGDGAEAFQRLVHSSESATVDDAWAEAMQSYRASASKAQSGTSFLVTHDVGLQRGTDDLLLFTEREERSRAHAAEQSLRTSTLSSAAGLATSTRRRGDDLPSSLSRAITALEQHILASLRVSSASHYFNHVLVCQAWSTTHSGTQTSACRLASKLMEDHALAPARAAMRWRASLAADQPGGREALLTAVPRGGQSLAPTPLQWVLYTLRRQLVVALANRAQVVLTARRLGLEGATSLSVSQLQAYADQCVRALPVARGLLGWHCPWPVPLVGHGIDTAVAVPSPEAVTEVAWTLRLLSKLHCRAALLYDAAGDTASHHRQLRSFRDELQRLNTRRSNGQRVTLDTAQATSSVPWATTSSLDVVCHIRDDGVWSALMKEVTSMLPPSL